MLKSTLNQLNKNTILTCLFTALLAATTTSFAQSVTTPMRAPTTFVHPGLLLTQAQITILNTQFKQAKITTLNTQLKQPKITTLNTQVQQGQFKGTAKERAFTILSTSKYGKLDYKPKPAAIVQAFPGKLVGNNLDLADDAQAAYSQALLYVITDNQQYAKNSMAILDAWSNTLKDIVPSGNVPTQPRLVSAWTAGMFLNTAELIVHHKKGSAAWPQNNINKFNSMINNVFAKYYNQIDDSVPGNWGTAAQVAKLSQAVFQNNSTLYIKAKNAFAGKLAVNIMQNGEILELKSRDCFHPEFTLINIAHLGLIDRHQGLNQIYRFKLPGDAIPRYAKGVEYMARSKYFPQQSVRDCSKWTNFDGYGEIVQRQYPKSMIPTFFPYINEARSKVAMPMPLFPGYTQLLYGPY